MIGSARQEPFSLFSGLEPIRGELLSTERLEQLARRLAHAQPVRLHVGGGRPLGRRLRENYRILLLAHRDLARAQADGQAMTPAGQWLVDNFHVIEAQVREIRDDLPAGFYRQLPKLTAGPFTDYPRVFALAWTLVEHTDSRFDPEVLARFIAAYQSVDALTIGELWAMAISLRIVLVENLRRVAQRVLENRVQRVHADAVADAILRVDVAAAGPDAALAQLPAGTLHPVFAVQLVARLRDQDPSVTPVLGELERQLAAQGMTIDATVRDVHQGQAAMSVTARNIITSMRMVSAVDWAELVETVSLVDAMLRQGSDFAANDFTTRNAMRTAIERLARGAGVPELEVTRDALQLAWARRAESDKRGGDPAYHLIGAGRGAFEAAIGFEPGLASTIRAGIRRSGLSGYLIGIGGLGVLFTALAVSGLLQRGVGGWALAGLALLALLPAADLAVALLNRLVTSWLPPAPLPGLMLEAGVPEEWRTMVVVPTLLTSPDAIAEVVERLEVHALGSPDGAISYALLTDWKDAATETTPEDAALLDIAAAGIARLNARHGGGFLLLHRRRLWNAAEGVWMGWERKRGKLHELNRLILGGLDTSFMAVNGVAPLVPPGTRFVVTLDSDTRMPRETVRRLIGKMAHPLNRPRFDGALGQVVEGYGILQPRVTPSLPVRGGGSLFQQAFSSTGGIDPYAAAVSDVYQDLLGEGSFAGKGIYDVAAMEQALAGRVPENAMLSHDLFEGVFARAGLASDVEVVEEFPHRYDVAASRQHRWTRGDWQLLPWIAGRPVPLAGRWKMLDNLRRSLTPPAMVLGLLAAWQLRPEAALFLTSFLLLPLLLPPLLPVLTGLWPRPHVSMSSHFHARVAELRVAAIQAGLLLVLLADQAAMMVDAIWRTVIRLFVTRRRLLEWTTAEQARASRQQDVAGHYQRMPGTLVVAALAILGGIAAPPGSWAVALPFALLWFAAPYVAWWSSRPDGGGEEKATAEEIAALRRLARRTWRYFDRFVTQDESMLPPDNFQEDPKPVVAHRTSPTNIGLYLLSTAAAHQLGWIGLGNAVERLEATFATLDRMERVNGHFLNWYDTTDLRPLLPKYVSSVDSGNLAGHLIALAGACLAWAARPVAPAARVAGVADGLAVAREMLARSQMDQREVGAAIDAVAARLGDGSDLAASLLEAEKLVGASAADPALHACATEIRAGLAGHVADMAADRAKLVGRLHALATRARDMALEMRFGFLMDPERKLMSIGFAVTEARLDESCYDLLASEARLASFLAIAKGDAPVAHWFRLGRATTPVGRGAALKSWSGSMFEYLMPRLVMHAPDGSMLATTERLAVQRQESYAAGLGLPWGMSESAFNVRDLELTYQYSNFGVPDLALKRGLAENAVIAPYATALGAMIDPAGALRNFGRLGAAGGLGPYGYYEALDYTPARVPDDAQVAVVSAYMAHHQGMSILAIANVALDGVVQAWFHADPLVQANELLLQERAPREMNAATAPAEEEAPARAAAEPEATVERRVATPHGPSPATHLLSNGRYSVMITAAGAGWSRWDGRAVTRWREDPVRDDWGSFVFLRDMADDSVWSAGFQPTGRAADSYMAVFTEERAEFTRVDGVLTTNMEVVVSSEDAAEVRRVTLTNGGTTTREVELTSFMEVVLARPADDAAHPAFSKMFVQTEFLPEPGILLATRRRRSPAEAEMWVAHMVVADAETVGDLHVETDRAAFIGRGHGLRDAVAISDGKPLGGGVGTVLDPVLSLRRRVRIAPGASARLAFWTIAGESRAKVLRLADQHRDRAGYARAFALAWTHAQVQLRHLGLKPTLASQFQVLAGHLIYANAALRPPDEVLRRGGAGPAGLWQHGISGDLPILLLRIDDLEEMELGRQVLAAHEYWRMKQLAVDVVILNEKAASYNQDLQLAIEAAVRSGQTRPNADGSGPQGKVYVLRADLIGEAARALLLSVARVVLVSRRGRLVDQLARLEDRREFAPARPAPAARPDPAGPMPALEFFNGTGGFAEDGREYAILLRNGQTTPAPWMNVVANPRFGCHLTADGGGYSWWHNSRENQITPWSNDPVSDRPGDVIYLRDEDTGALWSPTAEPVRVPGAAYDVRHGMGYSRFTTSIEGIASDLLVFVPVEDTVKLSRLVLRNTGTRPRRISVTRYVEWVLGPARPASAAHVVTGRDAGSGAVLARNPWHTEFGPSLGFLAMPGRDVAVTGDRREFLGRNGTLTRPSALAPGAKLSGRLGAGMDPCTAMQATIALPPGASVTVDMLLGTAATDEDALWLVGAYDSAAIDVALDAVRAQWSDVLDRVQVRTPDRGMDLMLNAWLLYQTLACRIWARSGFYQASGAFGFRDQLQDGMALVLTRPDLTRAHLLRAAGRQFVEGDMQHWWLPPRGQGVRTRISDDRVWLAQAALRYMTVTGDVAVLDEMVGFLDGPVLEPHEHERYFMPGEAKAAATLYEHCALGLDHALATGPHGLPLIGTGDWNDGMSRVGEAGIGESVWLGWFLHAALTAFAPVAESRGETARATAWRDHATALQAALEQDGWDGRWYRRGYFDDGTPLGSAASSECRIDAIAQSWAVISGAADPRRAVQAMTAVDEQLIRRHDRLALLFTPPFDHTPQDPGYIKGYPPGLRENGGQYTHAAAWSVIALAMLGEGDRAAELFGMVNPIHHALTAADIYRYKVEPYVIAADVYSAPGHVGRGGWTWYTGSAGWFYRAGLEFMLGVQREGDSVRLSPCIPHAWPGFEVTLRQGKSRYVVTVENHAGSSVAEASLDGTAITARPVVVSLADDGGDHAIRLVLR